MRKFSIILALALAGLFMNLTVRPSADGWVSIFDGKTLNGWKVTEESPSTFSVQDGAIVVAGPRAHLFYEGPVGNHNFKNFEWKAQVKTMPGSNSGMFIHTAYQPSGWPSQGYEIQVNQTHTDWRKTGSVYGLQDVKQVFVKDDEWYTEHIIVQGKKVTIKLNDKTINEYMEPDSVSQGKSMKKLSSGTVALQGHDPKSKVYFKDIQLKVLPD
ncbi:3-keto-disaccharide hydrolase [Spirosoma oryzicola]